MVAEQTPISTNGTEISGTIRATYYKNGERNIEENVKRGLGYEGVIEPQVIQKCGDRDKDGTYSIHNYSNCIPANPMSDRGQLVLEPVIVASRGRDPENPSNRKEGEEGYKVTDILVRQ